MTEFEAFIAAIERQIAVFPYKLVGDKNIAIRDSLILIREAAKHAIADATPQETADDYPPTQAAVIRDNGDPR